ncbi:MAG: hypothetical protein ACJ74U_18705 [Jatrophihabitantaceae bacterium]
MNESIQIIDSVHDQEISLGYIGPSLGVLYLQRFIRDKLFGVTAPTATKSGEVAGARDTLEVLASDILLTVGMKEELDDVVHPAGVLMPLRVHMVADLAQEAPAAQTKTFRLQLRRHRSRVRRRGYDWELASNDGEYDWFYDRMHIPTMVARHGERARSVEREEARRELFHKGSLLFVTSYGKRVAGIVLQVVREQSICNVRLVGWLDGDPQLMREGAVQSGYFFVRDWAAQLGLQFLDFQGSEPFLSKGTFQNKRRRGTSAILAPGEFANLRCVLTVREDKGPIRDFLVANPPISVGRSDRMDAVYFYDDRRAVRHDLPWRMEGIDGCQILHIDQFLRRKSTIHAQHVGLI